VRFMQSRSLNVTTAHPEADLKISASRAQVSRTPYHGSPDELDEFELFRETRAVILIALHALKRKGSFVASHAL
jgi:hypothetical protein